MRSSAWPRFWSAARASPLTPASAAPTPAGTGPPSRAAGLPPEVASRAVQEYLAVPDEEAFGAAMPVTP
jgi:hypothetical protein